MIALDTNVLVAAHRRDAAFHVEAATVLRELAEGPAPWGLPWPVLSEFVAVVTHPRVFDPPSTLGDAVAQVDAWVASPSLRLLGERGDTWQTLRGLLRAGRVTGPRVHDARVAAICLDHGVTRLLTADRDFSRFPALRTSNPLVTAPGGPST